MRPRDGLVRQGEIAQHPVYEHDDRWQDRSGVQERGQLFICVRLRSPLAVADFCVTDAATIFGRRVYEAGHEVPAFQPEVSFEIFNQIIKMESLHSVP